MTTYTQFNTNLAALSPTGVTKKFAYPPAALNTADLPAAWTQLPEGNEPMMTFGSYGGWVELKAQYIVAIEPAEQNTQAANYAAALTMMDAVTTALRAATGLCAGPVEWRIRQAIVNVAGVDYWSVVVEVTGNG